MDDLSKAKAVVFANFERWAKCTSAAKIRCMSKAVAEVRQNCCYPMIFLKKVSKISKTSSMICVCRTLASHELSDWQQYPRYLQALLVRLDRLEAQFGCRSGCRVISLINTWRGCLLRVMMRQLCRIVGWLRSSIQLFAQPMKTACLCRINA